MTHAVVCAKTAIHRQIPLSVDGRWKEVVIGESFY
jgi:hypothetical protein